MSITLKEVVEHDLIDKEILEEIPKECKWCGRDLVFSDSLNNLECLGDENGRCPGKIGYRLHKMLRKLGYDSMSLEDCQNKAKETGMISPFNMFRAKDLDSGIKELQKPKKVWEIVESAYIPDISDVAKKLFNGYESMEEAYADIKEAQVPYIANKLGLTSASIGFAVHLYNKLLSYEKELVFGSKIFGVIKDEREKCRIVVSNNINNYINKADYINSVMNVCKDKINIIVQGSICKTTDFLIDDNLVQSRYSSIINDINEKRKEDGLQEIITMGSEQFMNMMKKSVSEE